MLLFDKLDTHSLRQSIVKPTHRYFPYPTFNLDVRNGTPRIRPNKPTPAPAPVVPVEVAAVPTLDSIPVELPVELMRLILETGARIDRKMAAKFVLLCKEVYEWIDPILYSTVVILTPKDLLKFGRAIDAKGVPYIEHTLKNIYFDPYLSGLAKLLNPTRALRRLGSLDSSYIGDRSTTCSTVSALRPKELVFTRFDKRTDAGLCVLREASHIDLGSVDHAYAPDVLDKLARSAHLTHLAISNLHPDFDLAPFFANAAPQFEALLILGEAPRVVPDDVRLVRLPAQNKDNAIQRWEDRARSETGGMWAEADIIIAARRRRP